ncbi:MAG: SDR family NAD(P)-dependent oxidoreductase [Verrucomicrobia bacterium]|nr:MAG: SDR family NAD(P)-dependent oxidoreductase [Verrucomicrobiota bacterium]
MLQLVITGGGGGLGRALLAAFHGPPWQPAAPSHGELDVTDAAAVRGFFAGRRVDLLVCAAGLTRDGPLARLTESAWDEVIAVNFGGAQACAAAVLPGMLARGSGHIVFISSFAAHHPPPGQAAYATAKAGLLGLTQQFAERHGRHGIRVNAILPGFLETPMTRPVSAARRAAVLAGHALGAFNTPAAVAGFIHYLHHQLPHTSGQFFQLDSRPAT